MKFDNFELDFSGKTKTQTILEIGVNHNGSIEIAKDMVLEIKKRGGDIVKFQAFIAEEEISIHAEKANYQKETTGKTGGQLEMAKDLELTFEELSQMRDFCFELKIPFLCTAFDSKSLEFLIKDLNVKSLKVASSEVTALPFLAEIAKTNVDIILSTGASDLEEVARAIKIIENNRIDSELIIMHCLSEYPAPLEQINLKAMKTMAKAFGYPVGYSDHTIGVQAPILAAGLEACSVEKHFTLNRNMEGPDHLASIEPKEMSDMINGIRNCRAMLGNGIKKPSKAELPQIQLIRKSIVSKKNLKKGHIISVDDLALKRPAIGLDPKYLDILIGRELKKDLNEDEPLSWKVI